MLDNTGVQVISCNVNGEKASAEMLITGSGGPRNK